jgi:hypothetical protein
MADTQLYAWAGRLVEAAQRAVDDLTTPAVVSIAVTNVTPPTTFNAGTATAAETAQALGQLLVALQRRGLIT